MSRSRGTYSTLENWALDLAPNLPGAAGWVLLKLTAQVNYKRKTMTIGQLIDALPYKERTLQQACAYLVQEGYVVRAGNEHILRGACTELTQGLRKNARVQQAENTVTDEESPSKNSGITLHNKKELEGREERELKEQTDNPPTPQGDLARDITAPGGQPSEIPSTVPTDCSPDGEAADAAAQTPAKPVQEALTPPEMVKNDATSTKKVPPRRAASPPTAHQELFAAVALACYGGHDDLTEITQKRVGKVAKSLNGAKFSAEQVPEIVAWLRTTQSWRDAITPSVIEEQAPVWRAEQRGSLPARLERPQHVVKFTPRPRNTDEANAKFLADMQATQAAVRGVFND